MARSSLLDVLQSHSFWLADVTPEFSLDAFPFYALNPVLGFSAITAPELQHDVKEVKSGTSLHKRSVVTGVSVSSITLSRGAVWYESDLWRWFVRASHGCGAPRRNLFLVQFLRRAFDPARGTGDAFGALGAAAVGMGAAIGGGIASGAGMSSMVGGALGMSVQLMVSMGTEGLVRFPARTWYLAECVPTRLKVAGDFDAGSAEVSIQELEVQSSYVDEVSLFA